MEHLSLHSVGTNHKKFGWKKEKIKIYFVECARKTLGKVLFAECRAGDTRQSFFKILKQSLPSACHWALSKELFVECQIDCTWKNIFSN
jgi:hypothetical protein